MQENYPLLKQRSPLIEMGMLKRDTHAYLAECGIRAPTFTKSGCPTAIVFVA
jgi:hypothetical protein